MSRKDAMSVCRTDLHAVRHCALRCRTPSHSVTARFWTAALASFSSVSKAQADELQAQVLPHLLRRKF